MAHSRFEQEAKQFEKKDTLLPRTYVCIRADGAGFKQLAQHCGWHKPWDERALHLMKVAASDVLRRLPDIPLAYGHSDEFTFVLPPHSQLFQRNEAKLVSTVASTLASSFALHYSGVFEQEGDSLPSPPPSFHARCATLPSVAYAREYLSWRQADCTFQQLRLDISTCARRQNNRDVKLSCLLKPCCITYVYAGHVNNQYNTCFWYLVQHAGLSKDEAQSRLEGTHTHEKNELLFSKFGVNYSNLPAIHRRGTLLFKSKRAHADTATTEAPDVNPDISAESTARKRTRILAACCDIIDDGFWNTRPGLLDGHIEDHPPVEKER